MRYRVIVATGLLFGSMHARALVGGVDQTLPVKGGRPAVAAVNGEPIALDQFLMELDPAADQTQAVQGYGYAESIRAARPPREHQADRPGGRDDGPR